jgi:hypothetical protein
MVVSFVLPIWKGGNKKGETYMGGMWKYMDFLAITALVVVATMSYIIAYVVDITEQERGESPLKEQDED